MIGRVGERGRGRQDGHPAAVSFPPHSPDHPVSHSDLPLAAPRSGKSWSLLKHLLALRLLKKVQMQGGALKPERSVLEVRCSEWQSATTQQMGIFQQPDNQFRSSFL
jgi:hypothetical protein